VQSLYRIDELYGFKCFGITRINTPIRLTANNEIECLSIDGKRCVSNLDDDNKCRKFVKHYYTRAQFIKCSSMIPFDRRHVCQKAKIFFFKQWRCFNHTGIKAAIRIDKKTGKVKCLSFNGRSCIQGNQAINLCRGPSKLNEIPLTCRKSSMNRNSWLCKKAFAWFRYTGEWINKSKTNIDTLIRLDENGIIECLSKDGVNCVHGVTNGKKLKELANTYKKTVKCREKSKTKKIKRKCWKNSKGNRMKCIRYFKRKPTIIDLCKKGGRKCRKNKKKKVVKKTRMIKNIHHWCRRAKLFFYKNFVDFEGIILRGTADGHQKNTYAYKHTNKFYWRRFKKHLRIISHIPRTRYRWRIKYYNILKLSRKYLLWLRWKRRHLKKMRYLWKLRIKLKKRNRWSSRIRHKWKYVWGRSRMRLRTFQSGYDRWKIRIMNSRGFRKGINLMKRYTLQRNFSKKRHFNRKKWLISRKRNNRRRLRIGVKFNNRHRYIIRNRLSNLRKRRRRLGLFRKGKMRHRRRSWNRRNIRKRGWNNEDEEQSSWRIRKRSSIKTSTWR